VNADHRRQLLDQQRRYFEVIRWRSIFRRVINFDQTTDR
jgi:hypothetical protein